MIAYLLLLISVSVTATGYATANGVMALVGLFATFITGAMSALTFENEETTDRG